MSFAGLIALVIIFGFLILFAFSLVAINRPQTKEEDALRFKQDCESFDKYMEDKRKMR